MLSNANKNRHKTAIRAILSNAMRNYSNGKGLTVLNSTGHPTARTITTSPFGRIGKRLGSERSADGFVFDLPDTLAPTGDKMVLKVIFSYDDDPTSEISIGEYCGREGIGPKVFAAYRVKCPPGQTIYNIVKNKGALLSNKVNLFINYNEPKEPGNTHSPGNIRHKRFKYIYLIVMENLYENPKRHVVAAETLKKALTDPRFSIPFARIKGLREKMQKAGIIHADLHPGNIVIQKIQRPSGSVYFRPIIIDFGRSIRLGRSFASNQNINNTLVRSFGGRPMRQLAYRQTHLNTSLGTVFKESAVTNYLRRLENSAALRKPQNSARVATRSPNITPADVEMVNVRPTPAADVEMTNAFHAAAAAGPPPKPHSAFPAAAAAIPPLPKPPKPLRSPRRPPPPQRRPFLATPAHPPLPPSPSPPPRRPVARPSIFNMFKKRKAPTPKGRKAPTPGRKAPTPGRNNRNLNAIRAKLSGPDMTPGNWYRYAATLGYNTAKYANEANKLFKVGAPGKAALKKLVTKSILAVHPNRKKGPKNEEIRKLLTQNLTKARNTM